MHSNNSYPVCASCGDRIGVYEAMWLQRADDTLISTSRLNINQAAQATSRLYHFGCLAPISCPPDTQLANG